jgi:hypothetical protein
VLIRLQQCGEDRTRITLTHSGWGEGGQWDDAFEYFERAWGHTVLSRLRYRFSVGPVDWSNPPRFGAEPDEDP